MYSILKAFLSVSVLIAERKVNRISLPLKFSNFETIENTLRLEIYDINVIESMREDTGFFWSYPLKDSLSLFSEHVQKISVGNKKTGYSPGFMKKKVFS